MKHILAMLIATFFYLSVGQASAASINFEGKSLDSLSSPMVCAEEEKKKGGEDDEEPECE